VRVQQCNELYHIHRSQEFTCPHVDHSYTMWSVMTTSEQIYRDYWKTDNRARQQWDYYNRLYHRVKSLFEYAHDSKIIDIAGGNGNFLKYLGVTKADILDISDSGLKQAAEHGYNTIKGDIQKRFPVEENSYDIAFCCEVLEHLHHPCITLSEIHHVLKPNGILYVAQPNMRPDGTIHVRRYYKQPLIDDLEKCGFSVQTIDYVPAYSMPDAIKSDIKANPSWIRKGIQCINLMLSYLPWSVRYQLAQWIPDRFCLIFAVKAIKIDK